MGATPRPKPTLRPPGRRAAEPSSGRRRLSALDTSFLALESATTPMHVGALIVLGGGTLTDADGRVRIDAIRDEIASRLSRCPRMRQRIAPVPFGAARPVWVDDVDFDISQHVRSVDLSHPARATSSNSSVASCRWRCSTGRGRCGRCGSSGGWSTGRSASSTRCTTPWSTVSRRPRPSSCCSIPGHGHPAAVAGRVGAIRRARRPGIVGLGRPRGRRANGGAGRVRWSRGAPAPRAGRGLGRGVAHLLRRTTLAPRTSLNRSVGGRRRLATVQLDLAAIKRIGRARGCDRERRRPHPRLCRPERAAGRPRRVIAGPAEPRARLATASR